ncbi:ABC transporter substrate-binding protein [Pseudomonas japonica]|uniref:ABC transporter substrate-binding protein n=1 Tax=Pseudomonas japonica TaxID=256466 RepID=UPI0037F129D8
MRSNMKFWLAPLLAGILVGCGNPDESKPAASATRQVVFGIDGGAQTQFQLDPHLIGFAPHNRMLRQIFDSLVVLLPNDETGPWLARSWEVSADNRTYTFHLKEGVTFHDGTVLDAAAVKFNFERMAEPASFATYQDFDAYEKAEVVDPLTVRLFLKRPDAALLNKLSKSTFGIVSPAAVAKYGKEFASNPVGSGPFVFKSLSHGTQINLERNPQYAWASALFPDNAAPVIDRLILKNLPDETTRIAALKSGQVDAVDIVPPQNLIELAADKHFVVQQKELLNHNFSLYFNTLRAPLDDENVRTAVRLAIDVDSIVKTLYLGRFKRAWSPLSPSLPGYDASLENSWKYDPDQARKLLDGQGWILGQDGIRTRNGEKLRLVFVHFEGNREKRLDVITMVKNHLKKVGIDVVIDSVLGFNFEKIAKGEWNISNGSQFTSDPDVLRSIYRDRRAGGIRIITLADDTLSAWLSQASQETDKGQRRERYKKIQERIIGKTYSVPIYVLPYTLAHSSRVSGIVLDQGGFPLFQSARIAQP